MEDSGQHRRTRHPQDRSLARGDVDHPRQRLHPVVESAHAGHASGELVSPERRVGVAQNEDLSFVSDDLLQEVAQRSPPVPAHDAVADGDNALRPGRRGHQQHEGHQGGPNDHGVLRVALPPAASLAMVVPVHDGRVSMSETARSAAGRKARAMRSDNLKQRSWPASRAYRPSGPGGPRPTLYAPPPPQRRVSSRAGSA